MKNLSNNFCILNRDQRSWPAIRQTVYVQMTSNSGELGAESLVLSIDDIDVTD